MVLTVLQHYLSNMRDRIESSSFFDNKQNYFPQIFRELLSFTESLTDGMFISNNMLFNRTKLFIQLLRPWMNLEIQ